MTTAHDQAIDPELKAKSWSGFLPTILMAVLVLVFIIIGMLLLIIPFASIIPGVLAVVTGAICISRIYVNKPFFVTVVDRLGTPLGVDEQRGFRFSRHGLASFHKIFTGRRTLDMNSQSVFDQSGFGVMLDINLVWAVRNAALAFYMVEKDNEGRPLLLQYVETIAGPLLVELAKEFCLTAAVVAEEEEGGDGMEVNAGNALETSEMLAKLLVELNKLLSEVGIEVQTAGLRDLTYKPETAAAMSARQSAAASLAAAKTRAKTVWVIYEEVIAQAEAANKAKAEEAEGAGADGESSDAETAVVVKLDPEMRQSLLGTVAAVTLSSVDSVAAVDAGHSKAA